MKLYLKQIELGPLQNFIYLIGCCETRETAVVTAEEHQVWGGFGSAVASALARNCPVPQELVGIQDTYAESGKPDELMQKYGLTGSHIMEAARRAVSRKR